MDTNIHDFGIEKKLIKNISIVENSNIYIYYCPMPWLALILNMERTFFIQKKS
jgi:hypothetical protein